jgi:outer membrane protein
MNRIQSILLSVVALTLVCGAALNSGAAFAEVKIGYIDMQKAIQSTSKGKKAKKSLEKDFKAKKKELEKMEADLKKMSEDLEKKAMLLSDDVRGKKAGRIAKRDVEVSKNREPVST